MRRPVSRCETCPFELILVVVGIKEPVRSYSIMCHASASICATAVQCRLQYFRRNNWRTRHRNGHHTLWTGVRDACCRLGVGSSHISEQSQQRDTTAVCCHTSGRTVLIINSRQEFSCFPDKPHQLVHNQPFHRFILYTCARFNIFNKTRRTLREFTAGGGGVTWKGSAQRAAQLARLTHILSGTLGDECRPNLL